MTNRGFTLLEIMVAAALLSIVTAGAMAAFLAQSRATNTQQQTISANDDTREAVRLISNDVRSAAAGVAASAGGFTATTKGCDVGTIPFDGSGANLACLPPVFRSNTPLIIGTPAATGLGVAGGFAANCGDALHPGYQLAFSGGAVTVPPNGALFCPDDLVVLGVDDTNPLFMVESNGGPSPTNPGGSGLPTNSIGNPIPISFGGTTPIGRNAPAGPNSPAGAGYGFDDVLANNLLTVPAACALLPAVYCERMMLFGGATGAVLMNAAITGVGTPWANSNAACTIANCDAVYYNLIPSTPTNNLFSGTLSFGTVAMPAHLYRYAIEPIDAAGAPSLCTAADPCVSANLVRSVIVPYTAAPAPTTAATPELGYATLSSTVIVQGVVDMQVEFGMQSQVAGQGLIYVNSGGIQSAPATTALPQPPVDPTAVVDNCLAGATPDTGVWSGVCFPTGGLQSGSALNKLQYLRTVRLNLTIRSGSISQTRSGTAIGSSAAIGSLPSLQPAVQDLPTGNAEANQWGFTGAAFQGLNPLDGATYRQVSTEIYIRNLGWTNGL